MSAIRSVSAIKSFLAVGTVISGLAMSAGQLTAASFTDHQFETGVEAAGVGGPAITDTVLYADDDPDVFARAGAARDSFGFAIGASRTGRHVHDGLRKADYDEVTEVDSAGRPISVTQFDGDGRLVAAVRLDAPSGLSARAWVSVSLKSCRGWYGLLSICRISIRGGEGGADGRSDAARPTSSAASARPSR